MSTQTIFRGDTWFRGWTFLQADGSTPVDLAGCSVRLHLRDGDGELVLDCAPYLAIADAANGVVALSVPAAETAMLEPDSCYEFDLELTWADGSVATISAGRRPSRLCVARDVTV